MKNVALVTGASMGIGLELAREHAKTGNDLVLVARNGEKLNELKIDFESAYNISVYIIAKDLARRESPKEIYNELKQKQIDITYLINNAGFGDFGMFVDADYLKLQQMIDLNISTLTEMTHLFLKDMIRKKVGKVMNVASTAAFQSGPTMAVYYATKAYVLSFTEAVNNEVSNTGVTLTALCPGATESGFQAAAAMEESKLVKGKKLPTSSDVAKYGYKAMMNGKVVAIHGFMNAILANSVRFMPRSIVVRVTRMMQDK